MGMVLIEPRTAAELAATQRIFAEYAASIEHSAGCSLQQQNFGGELANLPGKYAPSRGAIFLAFETGSGSVPVGEPIGCIALRPLETLGPEVCELKRMYVRPGHRGKGVARQLCVAVLERARAAGYAVMKLDTDPTFVAAIALYRSLGFTHCPRYNDDPMEETLWFELQLTKVAPVTVKPSSGNSPTTST